MKSILLSVILLLTTGCAPLSQAPLVYNSKNIFGGRISAANPQTPGVDLNVGLTSEDTAFIPVAVAKLPQKLGGDGGNADITLIKGTYAGSINPTSVETAAAALRDAQLALNSKTAELKKAQDDVDKQKAEKAKYDTLINNQTTIVASLNKLDPSSPERTSLQLQKDQIATAIKEFNMTSEDMSDKTIKLSSTLAQLQTEKDSYEMNVKRATAELENMEGKSDAYSVFGSFDSGTSLTGSTSAGVTLGKMFSTGVAAQNISQGIQQSHNYLARKSCLDSLKAVVSGSVTADNAEKICGK